jgi:TonB family protein
LERPPVYPFEDARAQKSGVVRVIFRVDEKGHAKELRVVESSGPEFSDAVTRALVQWFFVPDSRGRLCKLEFRFVPGGGMSGAINWK